ncbi:hypothetical protein NX059_008242 [Plenodomus lindquistii]|nr:hypothetical protein NX059_008242 [Plenodomus lindquistii]
MRPACPAATVVCAVLARHAAPVHGQSDGIINDDKGPDPATFATALTGGEGCDASDIRSIRNGFAEMTSLFAAAVPFDPASQPSIDFFGSSIADHTDLIAGNLQRAANYGLLQGSPGPVNSAIHIRCDDPMGICDFGNKREGSHAAYNIGNQPLVVFCKDYLRMEALDRKIDKKANNQMEKDRLMEYYNRAALWARMVMHFSDIGKAVVQRATPGGLNSTSEWILRTTEGAMNTSVLAGVLNERPESNGPRNFLTLKYAYGATRSKLLAVLATQMSYDAANNAENYALYALGHYIVKRKGFYPNVPIMDFPNQATVLTNENLQDGERTKYAFFDMPDVLALPADMKLEGTPLPSSATSDYQPSRMLLCSTVALLIIVQLPVPFG